MTKGRGAVNKQGETNREGVRWWSSRTVGAGRTTGQGQLGVGCTSEKRGKREIARVRVRVLDEGVRVEWGRE